MYEKLDRVLMGSDWEFKFPLVSVRVLPRIEALSDHAPILLCTGTPLPQRKCLIKFELDGYIGMTFRTWLNSFRIRRSLGTPQSKGGITNYVRCVDTLGGELDI